jgi:hypothetical protein
MVEVSICHKVCLYTRQYKATHKNACIHAPDSYREAEPCDNLTRVGVFVVHVDVVRYL